MGPCQTSFAYPQIVVPPLERCLALVLRLVRRSLGEVGSFSEGGCEADSVGNGEFTVELDVHCPAAMAAGADFACDTCVP
jgi:hypothetical protein